MTVTAMTWDVSYELTHWRTSFLASDSVLSASITFWIWLRT